MSDRLLEESTTLRATGEIRILLVDAEPDFAEMTIERLERSGPYTVHSETDPHEALQLLEEGTFDCVVSDSQIHGMDGVELLERVRELSPDLPVILLASEPSEASASDAISAGVADYIRKESTPERFDLLAARIETAVDQYRTALEQELISEAVDVVSAGIVVLDADAEIVYTNRAFAILAGRDASAIVGRDFSGLYPVDEARRIREEILPELADSGVWQGRIRARRSGGSTFPQFLSLTELPSGGVVCVVRDITERVERERALERERNRASALFENLAEPAAYYEFENSEPVVREVNHAFEEMFGVTESEASGRSLDELIVPETHSTEGREINVRVRAGDIVDTQVERETADGLRRFDLLSVPLEPGDSGEHGFTIYRRLFE